MHSSMIDVYPLMHSSSTDVYPLMHSSSTDVYPLMHSSSTDIYPLMHSSSTDVLGSSCAFFCINQVNNYNISTSFMFVLCLRIFTI